MNYPRTLLALSLASALLLSGCGAGSGSTSSASSTPTDNTISERSLVQLRIGNDDVTTWLSFRNLEKVNILPVAEANTYELLDNKQLVFTAEALKRIEEVLA